MIDKIDCVLLSHHDLEHLGALPYLVGKLGLQADIYATQPVYKMGNLVMYDAYMSRKKIEQFDKFTLNDVDTAFDMIVQLKYSQYHALQGKYWSIDAVIHIIR